MSFHLIGLELGDEDALLDRALEALNEVEPGETAFLPESLAWTPRGSGRAFVHLIALAQQRDINIVTTLNLGGDLSTDLPGRDPDEQYDCVAIFTRLGAVHVPQAKLAPHPFETDKTLEGPNIGIVPYARWNRATLDLDGELVSARFLIGADLFALGRFTPAEIDCDLLVVLGNLPVGAEKAAQRLLGRALADGAARTAILVNAFDAPGVGEKALALKVEEVLDSTREPGPPAAAWSAARSFRNAFWLYEDAEGPDFAALAQAPARRGRIAVPRARWDAPLDLGVYPITPVF